MKAQVIARAQTLKNHITELGAAALTTGLFFALGFLSRGFMTDLQASLF